MHCNIVFNQPQSARRGPTASDADSDVVAITTRRVMLKLVNVLAPTAGQDRVVAEVRATLSHSP